VCPPLPSCPPAVAPHGVMQPTDLAAHRETRARQARRRLAAHVRQAALHATTDEHVELERLTRLVRLGYVEPSQAHGIVTDLRQAQARRAA
jgi:hypothetical protein